MRLKSYVKELKRRKYTQWYNLGEQNKTIWKFLLHLITYLVHRISSTLLLLYCNVHYSVFCVHVQVIMLCKRTVNALYFLVQVNSI